MSKRMRKIAEQCPSTKVYPLKTGIEQLKALSGNAATGTKFEQTVDFIVNLGVDPKKSDQVVRGACSLPHGTGKTVRVAVFAQGDKAAEATAAGADIVGFDDLEDEIKAGNFNFDVLIATPDAMPKLGKLGQALGPKGLMPNPKLGTVTPNPAEAVKNAKAGQARFRTDKAGIVHCGIGKVSFSEQALAENALALVAELRKLKPKTAKGIYLKKVTLSTTMGPGLTIDTADLGAA